MRNAVDVVGSVDVRKRSQSANSASPTRVRTSTLPTTSTAFLIKTPPAPPPSAHGSDAEASDTDDDGHAMPFNRPSLSISPFDHERQLQGRLSQSRNILGEIEGAQSPLPISAFSLGLMDKALDRLERGDRIPRHGGDRHHVHEEKRGVATSPLTLPNLKDEGYFILKMRAWEERCDRMNEFVRERRNDDRLRRMSVASGSTGFSDPRGRGTKRSFTECEGPNSEEDVSPDYDSDEYSYGDFLACDAPHR